MEMSNMSREDCAKGSDFKLKSNRNLTSDSKKLDLNEMSRMT
jgi:hypothetical protein